MKTKLIKVIFFLFIYIVGIGCEKEIIVSDFFHTWKLEGFGNVSNSSFEKVIPSDCENCFLLSFSENWKVSGSTSTNTFSGVFQINKQNINITNITATMVNELGNGQKYFDAISLVEKCEFIDGKFKLFYNQNRNYLLFKLLK